MTRKEKFANKMKEIMNSPDFDEVYKALAEDKMVALKYDFSNKHLEVISMKEERGWKVGQE